MSNTWQIIIEDDKKDNHRIACDSETAHRYLRLGEIFTKVESEEKSRYFKVVGVANSRGKITFKKGE